MRIPTLALAFVLAVFSPARADIHIAAAGPVTGPLASLGAQMRAGAEQAILDFNAAGGVLGQKLVLHMGDDQCDPKQAVSVANTMVGKGVSFVVGHFCSGSAIPASKVYDEEGVIMISPSATNPKLTDEGGPHIFRVCGRDDRQGEVLGKFLARNFAGKRIAMVHDKTAYGRGLADETRQALQAAGQKDVSFEAFTAGEKDYTALVSKLKNARADVLFLGGYHTEAGLILRQMRAQALGARLVGGDTLVTDEFWSITGAEGDGTLFSFAPDARRIEAAQAVAARFRKRGIEPSGYILYTYAAVQAWVQAAETAGSIDPEKVLPVFRARPFDTVIGRFHFNAKGDVDLPPYAMYEWHKGKFREYSSGN